jgi:succinoglycan biosynthesis transport protein ExoP
MSLARAGFGRLRVGVGLSAGNLWRRAAWIAGSVLLCVVAVLVYAWATRPLLTATARIRIPAAISLEERSRAVIEGDTLRQALSRENLLAAPDPLAETPRWWSRVALVWPGAPDRARLEQEAVSRLRSRLQVSADEGTRIISLSVSGRDGRRAARLANALAATAARAAAPPVPPPGPEELRQKLHAAEAALARRRAEEQAAETSGSVSSPDVDAQRAAAHARRAEAALRLEQIRRLQRRGLEGEGATSETLKSPVLARLRTDLAELKRAEHVMARQLGPRHPDLIEARRQIRELGRMIAAELVRITAAARSDLERARVHEEALERSAGGRAGVLPPSRDPPGGDRLWALEESAAGARHALETVEPGPVAADVVAWASAPPSGRGRLPILIGGALVAGLLLGTGLAAAQERRAPVVRTPAGLARLSGAPVLAVIPVPAAAGRDRDPPPTIFERPFSDFTAAIRALRQSRAGPPASTRARTVLVASAGPGDGTLVALNLALAAAAEGEAALLIDGDAGGRRLSSTLFPVPVVGYSEVLAGTASLREALVTGRSQNLRILPATGSEPLEPAAFRDRILTGFPRFDIIVIDGGGLDAQALAGLAAAMDDVLLVAAAGLTPDDAVRDAASGLRQAGAKLAGAVLLAGQNA